ncbi:protoporphyrinogen oxidase [Spirosoma utsteinense]|uniref:Coproporphyrinogen III oxidase n=1 Tax=Spirosoma utsteinense TaxID=2585773 RepID=A0ABR6WAJ3_9BACT|nr:protoporphyrinogen oxidase [Spirosoma utsteinense]MBC3783841.1 oxygen-dependent protoporphyrinogen oxidase [Spirosoma utsteinense]MBC3793580.1 oxygen-dependent protoporphyrinogen oxidase [Spirosoma utsteinense]
MKIGIIGAGISGLTLAYELQQRGIDYHLWEASAEPGGYIHSQREPAANGSGTYLREQGPNSLLGDADLLLWLDKLGLTPSLSFSKPVSKARYIFRNGQYRELPSGPLSLLFGNFFSWKTKLAILRERSNKTTSFEGETLAQFFRRRFSDEIVDYALAPFVAGIYAGDPEQLLVSETFPMLLNYEREYGSVLRGFIKNQSKAGRRQSFSFRNGMQMLPDALAGHLTHLSMNDPVSQISRADDGSWRVNSRTGTQTVDHLILAVGTDAAARLVSSPDLKGRYRAFADALRQVDYPAMTAVHSAYKRADVTHPLNGFGGLNPRREGRFAAGHIWSSSTFDDRCPTDEVLFTTFVGGAHDINQEKAHQPDEVIFRTVHQELADAFGISASQPTFRGIYRWERAIPQYTERIVAVKEQVEAVRADNLLVCANWYGGISLSDCMGKARTLAGKLASGSLINNF